MLGLRAVVALTALLQGLIWGAGVVVAVAWQVLDIEDPNWWLALLIPAGFVVGAAAMEALGVLSVTAPEAHLAHVPALADDVRLEVL